MFESSKAHVLFTRPSSWRIGAWLIMWWTEKEFSHVAVRVGDFIVQASHGYVNVWHVNNFEKENYIYYIQEWPEIDSEWIARQVGKKYAVMKLVHIVIRDLFNIDSNRVETKWYRKQLVKFFDRFILPDDDDAYICSEFAGKALRMQGIDDYTIPNDVYEIVIGARNVGEPRKNEDVLEDSGGGHSLG